MYTILICDDDRDIVSALDIYLTSEGYRTIAAYNGREAIQAAEENEIHLILMDVMMPELDGTGGSGEGARYAHRGPHLYGRRVQAGDGGRCACVPDAH